jgi:hypothetical protein
MKRLYKTLALVFALGSSTCTSVKPLNPRIATSTTSVHPNYFRARAQKFFMSESGECKGAAEEKGGRLATIREKLAELEDRGLRSDDWKREHYWDYFPIEKKAEEVLAFANSIIPEHQCKATVTFVKQKEEIAKRCGSKIVNGCCEQVFAGSRRVRTQIYVYNGSETKTFGFGLDALFSYERVDTGRAVLTLAHEIGHSKNEKKNSEVFLKELEANVFSLLVAMEWATSKDFHGGYILLINKAKRIAERVEVFAKHIGLSSNYAQMKSRYDADYRKFGIKESEKEEVMPYLMADVWFVALMQHFDYDLKLLYSFLNGTTQAEFVRFIIAQQLGKGQKLLVGFRRYIRRLENAENERGDSEYKRLLQDLAVEELKAANSGSYMFRRHSDQHGHTIVYGGNDRYFLVLEYEDETKGQLKGFALYPKCKSIGLEARSGYQSVSIIPRLWGGWEDHINETSFPFTDGQLLFRYYVTNSLQKPERLIPDESRREEMLRLMTELIARARTEKGVVQMEF